MARLTSSRMVRWFLALSIASIIFSTIFASSSMPATNAVTGNYPNCGAPTIVTLAQFEAGSLNVNPDQNSLNPPCNTFYELDGQTISSTPYTGDCNAYAQGYCDVHLPFNCSVSCLFEIAATWSAAGHTYPTGCNTGTIEPNVCVNKGDTVNAQGFFFIDSGKNHEFHSVANIVRAGSPPPPLAASFTFSPASPTTGQSVTFTAKASGGTSPYSYSWNFGDGSTGAGAIASHAYILAGSYTVNLTLKDSSSPQQTATSQQTITVTNPPPTLTTSFTHSPSSPQAEQSVTFTGSANGGTSPYTYGWSFGDGATGTGSSVTHTYSSTGSYIVNLAVKDSGSPQQTATSQQTVSVSSPSPLSVSFTITPSSPQSGQQITFTGSATGGTLPYSFTWDFGDGSTGTGSSVIHTYASSGSYPVTLTVKDSGSPQQAAKSQQSVSVISPPPLSVSFTSTPTTPDAGQSVSFTASSSGGRAPYGYSWSFGDGGNASASVVTHTFTSGGNYSVSLTVTDSAGNTARASKMLTVNPPISGSFSYSPSNPLPLSQVTFTASARGGTQPYSYSWNFGDGTKGSGQSVSHSYLLPGSYVVTLTITDANGETFATSQTIVVVTSLA